METYADIINALSKGDYFAQIQAVNDLKAKNEALVNKNEALANENLKLAKMLTAAKTKSSKKRKD
jgi:regulator of replication initiation timing